MVDEGEKCPVMVLLKWDAEKGFSVEKTEECGGDIHVCMTPYMVSIGIDVGDNWVENQITVFLSVGQGGTPWLVVWSEIDGGLKMKSGEFERGWDAPPDELKQAIKDIQGDDVWLEARW